MISSPTSPFPGTSDTSRVDRSGSTSGQAPATRMPPAPGGLLSRRGQAAALPVYSPMAPAGGLDKLYGHLQSPRASPGKSAIKWGELAPDGTVVVHPRRSVFPLETPSEGDKLKMQQAMASVRSGRLHKWMIDSEGALVVGPAKVTAEEWPPVRSGSPGANSLGHVTLVGGSPLPPGRMGGEWYLEKPEDGAGNEARFVINNSSGRYGEVQHLEPHHLENVAERFRQLGCLVTPRWIDMLARRKEITAKKAAHAAAATP